MKAIELKNTRDNSFVKVIYRIAGFLCLIAVLLLTSCSRKQVVQVKNTGITAMDSTLLCRQDSLVKILIGERITPMPLASQFVENELGELVYILLDENTLYWFNKSTEKLLKSRKIEACGILNNYSGFLCLKDTTFIYNYKEKVVYMLDSAFSVQKRWNLHNANITDSYFDPEALTDSPMLYADGRVMLSGIKLGQVKEGNNPAISCCIHVVSDKIAFGANLPSQYLTGDFGGVYFNTIYHTLGAEGQYLYSFPADHNIYIYSSDFVNLGKFYMGSRYASEINSSDNDSFELFKDKELRIKYYVSQYSYSNILYDKYKKLYYRIALHPLTGWKPGESFAKPFSIIVMDAEGRLLTETPIQKNYQDLNLHNMHITRDGLLIQQKTSDENRIEFVQYVIKQDEK